MNSNAHHRRNFEASVTSRQGVKMSIFLIASFSRPSLPFQFSHFTSSKALNRSHKKHQREKKP